VKEMLQMIIGGAGIAADKTAQQRTWNEPVAFDSRDNLKGALSNLPISKALHVVWIAAKFFEPLLGNFHIEGRSS